MPKAISTIPTQATASRPTDAEEQLKRLVEATAGESTSLLQVLQLLHALSEKGLMDAATAMLEQSSEILRVMLERADSPGGMALIQNAISVASTFASLNATAVARATKILADTTKRAEEIPPVAVAGMWDLLKSMGDPDIQQGLSTVLTLFKALGQSVREAAEEESAGIHER